MGVFEKSLMLFGVLYPFVFFFDFPKGVFCAPPVLDNIENTTLTVSYYRYPEDAAFIVSRTITVNDTDSIYISQAQITVSTVDRGDMLFFHNTDILFGDYDCLSGTLTITGNDTVASYEEALQSVTYQNKAYHVTDRPNYHEKTISFQVTDNEGETSDAVSRESYLTTGHRIYTDGTPGVIIRED
mmetsp:Transcript_6633/g.8730  ORF Transcript_6633/g.8730 Transcript_6633/m.8730 type:complete len:185 (-) Transcript_6633:330-884(-)